MTAKLAPLFLILAAGTGSPALAASVDADALASRIHSSIALTEAVSVKAQYPRNSVINAVMKSMWQAFYESEAPLAVERAAIDKVAADVTLSAVQRECVTRMQTELTYN